MTQSTLLSRRHLIGAALAAGSAAALPFPARAWWRDAAAFPAVERLIDGYVTSRRLPGALACIGRGSDAPTLIARGVQGLASERPVDADTLWRIYSMTKPVTAMAIMMLIEEGKLTLDQPLADIIPAYARMQVLATPASPVGDVRPATTAITIRQLLTHTAGLGYSIVQTGPIKAAYEAAGIVPGRVSRMNFPGISRAPGAPSLEQFADRLASLPLVYEPGTRWSYSVSIDLLGRIVEIASGMEFAAFLDARLFKPLGMNSTWFTVPASEVGRLSDNVAVFAGQTIPLDPASNSIYTDAPDFPAGGAGLVSSARDYDRFLAMLLGEGQANGVRVMSAATARLAMSNLIADSVDRKGTFIEGQGFGAGGRVTLASSPQGPGIFGWAGAAGTIGWVDRGRRLRVGGYVQFMPPGAYSFQEDMMKAVARDVMA